MKYPTIKELKKMLIHMDVSILDVPWEKLKQGQLLKILRWERARDKKAKPLPPAKRVDRPESCAVCPIECVCIVDYDYAACRLAWRRLRCYMSRASGKA